MEYSDAVEAAARMPDVPNVWTDGSLVLDEVTGVSCSGSGFFAHKSELSWIARRWGHVDHVRTVGGEGHSDVGVSVRCSWVSTDRSED